MADNAPITLAIAQGVDETSLSTEEGGAIERGREAISPGYAAGALAICRARHGPTSAAAAPAAPVRDGVRVSASETAR
jgi:hypothetical protein